MPNRQQVITRNTNGLVEIYDILRGSKVNEFPGEDYSAVKKTFDRKDNIPNWFSIDTRTGRLVVHLEYPQILSTTYHARKKDLLSFFIFLIIA